MRARRRRIATLPTYVALGEPDGLKLCLVDGRYYRDAGEWSIDVKDGVPLYSATEEDWAKDNGK